LFVGEWGEWVAKKKIRRRKEVTGAEEANSSLSPVKPVPQSPKFKEYF
jgi:hypothetical protein